MEHREFLIQLLIDARNDGQIAPEHLHKTDAEIAELADWIIAEGARRNRERAGQTSTENGGEPQQK